MKIARLAMIVVTLSGVAAGLYWHFYLAPYYWFSAARHRNMQGLMEAVVQFNSKMNRLPASLQEVVAAGLLPPQSTIYFSPMAHHSLWLRSLPYQRCEYQVTFSSDLVTIAIPERVAAQRIFAFVTQEDRSMEVSGQVKTVDTSRVKF